MVDFNNEATVSTPPGDIVKVAVLEARAQVIEALESYHIMESSDTELHRKKDILRGRILNLWYQIQAMVKRRIADEDYQKIAKVIYSQKLEFDKMRDLYEWMNTFVDDMGLTYIDSRAKYDRTRVEDANMKKGL